jgi:RNA polymerase sigma factor (TIGR02999 family)
MTPSGIGSTFEEWLALAGSGDRAAYDRVFAETYRELQQLAHHARRRLHGATLDTTALVHECYLRLLKRPPDAANAAHFLGIAARAMRHLLIERARARLAAKRGADARVTGADADDVAELRDARELIEIDDLLRTLERRKPQQATIVECRFFGGLSEQDTAKTLGISVRTVQREWMLARQWLAGQH